jgi:hypothetical protein
MEVACKTFAGVSCVVEGLTEETTMAELKEALLARHMEDFILVQVDKTGMRDGYEVSGVKLIFKNAPVQDEKKLKDLEYEFPQSFIVTVQSKAKEK